MYVPCFSTQDFTDTESGLDYNDFSSAKSIKEELQRGAELSQQKSKTYKLMSNKQYELKLRSPGCSKKRSLLNGKSSHTAQYNNTTTNRKKKIRQKNTSMNELNMSTNLIELCCTASKFLNETRCKRKLPHAFTPKKDCPLRIAELAEPSKRHCLETWKNKGRTLPNFMVHRLKQRVRDEIPIVKINDAFSCFEAHKKRRIRKQSKRSTCRKKVDHNDSKKILSAVFGYKIKEWLLRPQVTTCRDLSSSNITKIIYEEISKILNKNNEHINKKNNSNIQLQIETANKITAWIQEILDETSMNQMLEDLNELEEKEGHVWDLIDEVIEAVMLLAKIEDSSSTTITKNNSESEYDSATNQDFEQAVRGEINVNPINIIDFNTNHFEQTPDINDQDQVIYESKSIIGSILADVIKNCVRDDPNTANSGPYISGFIEEWQDTQFDDKKTDISNKLPYTNENETDQTTKAEKINDKSYATRDIYDVETEKDIPVNSHWDKNIAETSETHYTDESQRFTRETEFPKINIRSSEDNFSDKVMKFDTQFGDEKTDITNAQSPNQVVGTNENETDQNTTAEKINDKNYTTRGIYEVVTENDISLHGLWDKNASDTTEAHNTDETQSVTLETKYPQISTGLSEGNFTDKMKESAVESENRDETWKSTTKTEQTDEIQYFTPENNYQSEIQAGLSKIRNTDELKTIPTENINAGETSTGSFENKNTTKDEKNIATEVVLTNFENQEMNVNDNNDDKHGEEQAIIIDENLEESLKKVKFSNLNIVIVDDGVSQKDSQRFHNGLNIVTSHRRLSPDLSLNYPKGINLLQPNLHLLSDADEPWIGNMSPPTIKVSASVSKSVTSLGFISEIDEMSTASIDAKYEKETFSTEFIHRDMEFSEELHHELITELVNLEKVKINEENFENGFNKNEHKRNSSIVQLTESPETYKQVAKNYTEMPLIFKKSNNNREFKIEIMSIVDISPEIIKKNYIKTKTEITQTDDIQYISKVPQIKYIPQHEIRIWCKGLENVISSLEEWSQWMDKSRTYINYLRKNEVEMYGIRINENKYKLWTELKKNVDSDVKTWLNLKKSLDRGLNSYRNYYSIKNKKDKWHYNQVCKCNEATVIT
ncbi:putative uncharacterized protein DDB_G0282133 isoform X2 [Leptidea sinapis]|uniref:putative uncharacterized protein DDB_G0282133 isoform X2 n=1 Tax=Leptidea sinapis TaxID=189913 RepID=UPI0021C2B46D|nr:putative uncharacterized protein DDB_G0282133 isoform X2 [Leptidea sinapis]